MKKTIKISLLLASMLNFVCIVNAQPGISRHWLKGAQKVEFDGYSIVVTDADAALVNYKIKGVCYSIDPYNLQLLDNIDTHITRWKALGVNSIRTYRPLAKYRRRPTDLNGIEYDIAGTKAALDKIAAAGITVLVGFSNAHDIQTPTPDIGGFWEDGVVFEGRTGVWYYHVPNPPYKEYITHFGNHPAILGFAMGNEYNYHPEWFGGNTANWLPILATAASQAKMICPNKPVVVVHGEIPSVTDFSNYNAITDLDGIFVNVYRGMSFGNLFDQWSERTGAHKTPLVIGEYGRSSQSGTGENTSDLQVNTIEKLWTELKNNFSGVVAGGYVFSYIDEAWKGEAEYNAIIGSEAHLGLYNANGTIKPAGTAFANQDNYTSSLFENKANKSMEYYTVGNTLYINSFISDVIDIYDTKGALIASLHAVADKVSQITLQEGVYIGKSKTLDSGIKVVIGNN